MHGRHEVACENGVERVEVTRDAGRDEEQVDEPEVVADVLACDTRGNRKGVVPERGAQLAQLLDLSCMAGPRSRGADHVAESGGQLRGGGEIAGLSLVLERHPTDVQAIPAAALAQSGVSLGVVALGVDVASVIRPLRADPLAHALASDLGNRLTHPQPE